METHPFADTHGVTGFDVRRRRVFQTRRARVAPSAPEYTSANVFGSRCARSTAVAPAPPTSSSVPGLTSPLMPSRIASEPSTECTAPARGAASSSAAAAGGSTFEGARAPRGPRPRGRARRAGRAGTRARPRGPQDWRARARRRQRGGCRRRAWRTRGPGGGAVGEMRGGGEPPRGSSRGGREHRGRAHGVRDACHANAERTRGETRGARVVGRRGVCVSVVRARTS